jgi:hypothetical protein
MTQCTFHTMRCPWWVHATLSLLPLKVLGTSGYPKAHTSTSCVKLIGSLTEGLQHGSYWWDYSHDSTGVFLEAFPRLEMPKQTLQMWSCNSSHITILIYEVNRTYQVTLPLCSAIFQFLHSIRILAKGGK